MIKASEALEKVHDWIHRDAVRRDAEMSKQLKRLERMITLAAEAGKTRLSVQRNIYSEAVVSEMVRSGYRVRYWYDPAFHLAMIDISWGPVEEPVWTYPTMTPEKKLWAKQVEIPRGGQADGGTTGAGDTAQGL